jgi:acetyl-CoA C-acetyltransferase
VQSIRRVAVIGGNRIPFARSNSRYASASNADMLGAALDGLVARFGLAGQRVGEVVAGAVLKHARDFNLTREVVLGSRLDPHTPAYDIQQACGTGLEAAILVANKIALGQIEVGIAGGVDTRRTRPCGQRGPAADAARRQLRRPGGRAQARRPATSPRPPPEPRAAAAGLSMGEHMALTALSWGSPRGAGRASAPSHGASPPPAGLLRRPVTPPGVNRDQPRAETSEKLGCAGRSSAARARRDDDRRQLDAADRRRLRRAARSEEWARAPVTSSPGSSTPRRPRHYVHGGEGLLMAPAYAVPRLLNRVGLKLGDFDFYEIHEAFASQVLATLAAWQDPDFCSTKLGLAEPLGPIDRTRLNVNGSSLAAGHPFAATGGRLLATLAKLLAEGKARSSEERAPASPAVRTPGGTGRGLISICAAGGQGVTAILERYPGTAPTDQRPGVAPWHDSRWRHIGGARRLSRRHQGGQRHA